MATKLVQWLVILSLFFSVWASVVFDLAPVTLDTRLKQVMWPLPVYLLIVLACYSLTIIGYRTATFNDCVEASEELQREIKEARADLKKKGLKIS
ncbi:dolichol-phosphate mannosyltransferase subunit 3-like [Glandiceps talaboti]